MKTVGIFLAGQQGDIMSALSVIKYRNELWGDSKIVWYADKANFDLFKYQEYIEVREFPRGFGYAERTKEENQNNEGTDAPLWEDWAPLVDWNNHMNIALKYKYSSLQDIDMGYFPAPHQMTPTQRHGMEYPQISKKVFGVPYDWAWHPVIDFSESEMFKIGEFITPLANRKIICLETFAGSGQSILSDLQVKKTMEICEEILGKCYFIFVSNKYLKSSEQFPADILNQDKTFFAGQFTVRQCGFLVSLCDMLISVSSGITVAASAWNLGPVPILQFCGSPICSTRAMALGRFELVTHDNKPLHVAQEEYYERLKLLLKEIK